MEILPRLPLDMYCVYAAATRRQIHAPKQTTAAESANVGMGEAATSSSPPGGPPQFTPTCVLYSNHTSRTHTHSASTRLLSRQHFLFFLLPPYRKKTDPRIQFGRLSFLLQQRLVLVSAGFPHTRLDGLFFIWASVYSRSLYPPDTRHVYSVSFLLPLFFFYSDPNPFDCFYSLRKEHLWKWMLLHLPRDAPRWPLSTRTRRQPRPRPPTSPRPCP